MNVSQFISSRIRHQSGKSFAATVSRLAVFGLVVGISTLIIAFAILGGFKRKVRERVYDFDAHIHLTQFGLGTEAENQPVPMSADAFVQGKELNSIKEIYPVAFQKGILHANANVMGVVFKGIDSTFDSTRVRWDQSGEHHGSYIEFGGKPHSRDLIVSRNIADKLQLKVGDDVRFYSFIDGRLKPKKLYLKGIYRTDLEEFDERLVLGDINVVRSLQQWPDTLAGGFEVVVQNPEKLNETRNELSAIADYYFDIQTIEERFTHIFDWLGLLDQNVTVLIFFLFFIAFFNVVATMYILIMERTQMVGLLKALGATDGTIQRIFWRTGLWLLIYGLIGGNALGLGVCALQDFAKVIPLDASNYYMDYVPIYWDWEAFFLVNVVAMVVMGAVLALPVLTVRWMKPVKAIRFD